MDPTEVIDPGEGPSGPRRRGRRAPREVQEIALRDGSRLWVRPIQPDDRARIEQGLRWLSPKSRYLRFHSHVDHLSRSQLDYLVDVDHHDHDALVGIDPDLPDEPGVAVARYIRLKEDPGIAEAAITVIDSHQGRGIGTALIGLLEQLAYERGITTFRNYVLAENTAMLQIFRELGGEVVCESPGVYRVDVPVPPPDGEQPDTPAGRWVASMGRQRGETREAWAAFPVMWFLRRIGVGDPDESEGQRRKGESRLLKNWAAKDAPVPEDPDDEGPDDEGPDDEGPDDEDLQDDGAHGGGDDDPYSDATVSSNGP